MKSTFTITCKARRAIFSALYAALLAGGAAALLAFCKPSVYQAPFIKACAVLGALAVFPEVRATGYKRVVYNAAVLLALSFVTAVSLDLFNNMYQLVPEQGWGVAWIRLLLSSALVFLLYLLFESFIPRVRTAAVVGIVCFWIFGFVSYVLTQLRGARFLFADLSALSTAANVAGGYSGVAISDAFYYGFFGLACMLPFALALAPGKKHMPACLACYLVFLYGFFGIYSSDFEKLNYSWLDYDNSYVYAFFANAKMLEIKPDLGYSTARVEKAVKSADRSVTMLPKTYDAKKAIAEAFPEYTAAHGAKPNIIVVMNESFADLSVFGDLRTDQPVTPVLNGLENSLQGDVFTEVFGGGTADSEYSFLTGNSTLLIPENARPYQLYVSENTPSMVSALNAQGYESVAIHPGHPAAWNRNVVYPDFGFEKFISMAEMPENSPWVRSPSLLSDAATYQEIEHLYETKGDAPLFVFDVTIQNHGGYTQGFNQLERVNSKKYDDETDEYLSLVRASDKDFGALVDYFRTADEPTLICMFGDHQPRLSTFLVQATGHDVSAFSLKESQRMQATPYVIWANYPLPKQAIGSVSINYLGTLVTECAGLERTPYNIYLANLHKNLIIFDRKGLSDAVR